MKRIFFISALIMILLGVSPLIGQQLNGQAFSFSKGKNAWSDTIYKKLLTKKMKKAGQKPVLLAIRYKFVSKVDEGNWYQIAITNKSHDTKVKFDVASNHNQDIFTVKLNPDETKVLKKLYYHLKKQGSENMNENEYEFFIDPYEELMENRQ